MKEVEAMIARLDKEESDLLAQLNRVRTAREAAKALTGASVQRKTGHAPKPAGKPKKRAPKGELANAIKIALAAKPGLGNAEIRAAVKATHYPWSLEPLHVTKTLTKLVESKEITFEGSGPMRKYSVAAPAKE